MTSVSPRLVHHIPAAVHGESARCSTERIVTLGYGAHVTRRRDPNDSMPRSGATTHGAHGETRCGAARAQRRGRAAAPGGTRPHREGVLCADTGAPPGAHRRTIGDRGDPRARTSIGRAERAA